MFAVQFIVKKDVKSKVAAKKWLWWYANGKKILVTIIRWISVAFSIGFGTKFTWIVITKFLAISLHCIYFLPATLDFRSFFTMAFCRATHFLQLDWFGLDIINMSNWKMYYFWRILENRKLFMENLKIE